MSADGDLTAAHEAISDLDEPSFQRLTIRLLESMGYIGAAKSMGPGPAGIVQGVVESDEDGRLYVEAHRSTQALNDDAVIGFLSAIDRFRLEVGLLITTTTVDANARERIAGASQRVVAIEGPRLARLVQQFGLRDAPS